MKIEELKMVMLTLQATYRTEVSGPQTETYWRLFSGVPSDRFARAVDQHMADPDHGRFFPNPAHIMRYLIASDERIASDAEAEFYNDPTIDGTSSWEAKHETAVQRYARRDKYCRKALASWKTEVNFEDKLSHSGVVHFDSTLSLSDKSNISAIDGGKRES